jgi:hypothetical protein
MRLFKRNGRNLDRKEEKKERMKKNTKEGNLNKKMDGK